jgi:ATP-dependent protease ClpP protease subunit
MFKYCSNPDSSEPIMLLNKQIGMTCNEDGAWDGEPYIDGAQFQEELMLLDSMEKKRIQIWIVSPGGNVIQAMNIYSAILKSITPVDTYNGGLCASSAGLIFMAGRKRYMADYAQLMMHPVSGETDSKSYEAFMEMCTKMLSPKSNQTVEEIRAMLDAETWLNAEQCLELGICTCIEYTTDSNTKYMPQGSTAENVKALMSYSNTFLNSKINSNNYI